MTAIRAVHQCLFCSQTFGSSADKDDHILEHFSQETCADCNQNLIRIGANLYTVHSTVTCIKRKTKSDEDIESCFIGETENEQQQQQCLITNTVFSEAVAENQIRIKTEADATPYHQPATLKKITQQKMLSTSHVGSVQCSEKPIMSVDSIHTERIIIKTEPVLQSDNFMNSVDPIDSQNKQTESNEIQTFVCSICSKSLKTMSSLKKHMNRHNDENQLKCLVEGCDEYFVVARERDEHMQAHTVESAKQMNEQEEECDWELEEEQPEDLCSIDDEIILQNEIKAEPFEWCSDQSELEDISQTDEMTSYMAEGEYEDTRMESTSYNSHSSAENMNDKQTSSMTKKNKLSKQKKPRSFVGQVNCVCKMKCADKIDIARQKEIFDEYHNDLSWSQKVLFIRKFVVRHKIQKTNLNPRIQLKKREFYCDSFLIDGKGEKQKVCQTFLSNVLQVPRATIFRAIASAKRNPNAIDKRGKFPAKQADERDRVFIKKFITELPVYESKRNRSESSAKFLHPSLKSVKQLYLKYQEKCSEMPDMRKPLSLAYFTRTFKMEFNLIFFKTQKKICRKCASVDSNLKKKDISSKKRSELDEEKNEHMNMVRNTLQTFFDVVEKSQKIKNVVVLTFKLGKPIDIPSIHLHHDITKRRLWLHNFCIFDETQQMKYLYVWPEFTASKGSQEIGSCLIRHFTETLPKKTKQLILYSQPDHGQNCNVKLCLIFKKFLHSWPHTELKTIEQRFFIDGHGYTKCDEYLDSIQNPKKNAKEIWTLSDWFDQQNQDKKNTDLKIVLKEMRVQDFLSSEPLENLISNQNISNDNRKIQWKTFQKIIYKKENPFGLQVVTYDSINDRLMNINFRKRLINAKFDVNLPILYPNGLPITKKKYNDLQSLLKHVPPEFHSFYNELKYTDNDDDRDFALCNRQSSDDEEEEEE